MRFADFLRSAVVLSAGAASLLAAMTIIGASDRGDTGASLVGVGWWLIAAAIGTWLGHRPRTTDQIGSLLAAARTQTSLPDVHPARTLMNRLWPLLACTVVAGGLAFVMPQVPAIASGFAIIWALAWRRQSSAVRAIEDRDGARFYLDRTSPLKPIRLVRTPGFRSNLMELDGVRRSVTNQVP
jgi:hypothetical protein